MVHDRALEAEADRLGIRAASSHLVQPKRPVPSARPPCTTFVPHHTHGSAARSVAPLGARRHPAAEAARAAQTVQRQIKFSPNWALYSEKGGATEQAAIRAACTSNTTARIKDNAEADGCDVYVRTGWHTSDSEPTTHAQAVLGFSDWRRNDTRVGCNRDYTCHIFKDGTGECFPTSSKVIKKREEVGATRNTPATDTDEKKEKVF